MDLTMREKKPSTMDSPGDHWNVIFLLAAFIIKNFIIWSQVRFMRDHEGLYKSSQDNQRKGEPEKAVYGLVKWNVTVSLAMVHLWSLKIDCLMNQILQ